MDRTLNPVKRGNKRRRARNWKAWQLFSRTVTPAVSAPTGLLTT